MKAAFELLKLGLGLATSGAIAALVLGLVFFPGLTTGFLVNRLATLEDGGVQLTGFLGVSLRTNFEELSQAVEAADADLLALQEKMACLVENRCSEGERAAILVAAGLSQGPGDAPVAAQLPPLTREVDQPSAPAPLAAWMIVAGADKSGSGADYERARLEKAGYDAVVLKRDGQYRTVALFATRQEADEALAGVTAATRPGAYIRAVTAWCKSLTIDESGTMGTCN